ncbi:MAG: hypothetical protein EHM33_01005 [Chloroflexi bacterium]|nr:MAG: hypothetical protein EHM33_01005 [Chloroflexota bacterium]
MSDANSNGIIAQEVTLYDVDGAAVSASNPLPVALQTTPTIDIGDVTLLAGEAHVGQVGGNTKNIDVTPTLTVHADYVTGDFVGTSGTPITFTDAARVNAGTGWVIGALLENDVAEAIACELWLFDATVTPPADSAAWSISDADAKKCIGVIKFPAADWVQSALNAVCRSAVYAIPFTCGAASKNLFGCLVTRGTLTSTGLTVRLNVAQD